MTAHALPNLTEFDDPLFRRTAALFAALSDPERLKILARLAEGDVCVRDLAKEFGEGMSTVSQRLKLLHNERLVTKRREGKHVFYSLYDQHVVDLLAAGLEHVMEAV